MKTNKTSQWLFIICRMKWNVSALKILHSLAPILLLTFPSPKSLPPSSSTPLLVLWWHRVVSISRDKKQKQKRLVYFLMLLSLPGMLFFSLDCLNPTSNLLQGPHQTLPLPWESPVCPGEKSCCDTHGSLCGLLPLSPHTTVTCVCIASPQRNYTPSGRNQHSYSGSTTTLALIKMHWMNKQPRIFQNNSIETPTQTKWIRRTPLKSQLILKEVHTSLQPMPKHWPNNSVHFEATRDSLCLSYHPSTWVSEEAVSLLLAKNPSDDLLMR